VPFIRPATYAGLLELLARYDLALLAFECADRAHYGMLETDGERVREIMEWKYWKDFSAEKAKPAQILQRRGLCRPEGRPAHIHGSDGQKGPMKSEACLTANGLRLRSISSPTLLKCMNGDGLLVGMTSAPARENDRGGFPESLRAAQELYANLMANQAKNSAHS